VAYLKQAIQDLPANIFLIRSEQLRVQELVDVSRKVVFGQQVFHFTNNRVSLSFFSFLSCADSEFVYSQPPLNNPLHPLFPVQ
jgi:hypothetical protein